MEGEYGYSVPKKHNHTHENILHLAEKMQDSLRLVLKPPAPSSQFGLTSRSFSWMILQCFSSVLPLDLHHLLEPKKCFWIHGLLVGGLQDAKQMMLTSEEVAGTA